MLSIVVSTNKDQQYIDSYRKSIINSIGIREKDFELLIYTNHNEFSLSELYNRALKEASNDYIIFMHDDLEFDTPNWGRKFLKYIEKNSEYGIIGIAGSKYLDNSGKWWSVPTTMYGCVNHKNEGKKWTSTYSEVKTNKVDDVVLVDGLLFLVNKKQIKYNFDERFNGFHFYDLGFCVPNYVDGVNIGVITDIRFTHLSIGETNDKWEENRQLFTNIYQNVLPISTKYEINLQTIDKSHEKIVSIIIPCFNNGIYLKRSLDSVIKSTYTNIEIILINDGSTDPFTIMLLNSIVDNDRIKIIHQNNSGVSKSRNNGIKICSGDYILPLDPDDFIDGNYIMSCVNVLNNNHNISPVYCDTIHIGELNGTEKRPEYSFDRLKQSNFIVNCSMFSKEIFLKTNGYDEQIKGWEDYCLWVEMGLLGFIGKRIPKPYFYYFHHEKQDKTISYNANLIQNELYDYINQKYNLNK